MPERHRKVLAWDCNLEPEKKSKQCNVSIPEPALADKQAQSFRVA
jgi:hypothetical protein